MEYTAKQEQTIRDKEQENILLKQQNAKYEQTLNAKDQEIQKLKQELLTAKQHQAT